MTDIEVGILYLHAGDVSRLRGHPPRFAAAAHAADVADQRDLGHRRGRRDPDHRRGARHRRSASVLGFVAVTAATINVVSGFLITDRMLKMFKTREPAENGES